ncbi:unnamed protein product [Rotaria magnacalcarata]|uniref:Uncharacterized protein n=1 Tax=Rotaria magnacalcarata TaxID=392030 RepID=A0A816SD12_9BILA|nr:unnamed protein product [Rotaria magnacalcarata]
MRVESTRLLIVLVCIIIRFSNTDALSKRQQCRDFAGDRSNCQRFIRCFHNLRVLFTCASGTAYVPELQTCVAKELVTDCNDPEKRVEVTASPNGTSDDNDDYPTIEADLDSLEAPMQKSLSSNVGISVASRRFGCSSYCYNDGVCVLVGQTITCRCQSGYIGVRCQIGQSVINIRQPCGLPCVNGNCQEDTDTLIQFCNCSAGFTGDLCDVRDTTPVPVTNTTTASNSTILGAPCPTNPCGNGGLCFTVPGGGFRCLCAPGYIGILCGELAGSGAGAGAGLGCTSGNNCQTSTVPSRRTECLPNPCQNGGICYLTVTTFGCACASGYSGTCCEINLAVSNPCLTNPCINGGVCQIVAVNTYRCVCPSGLLGVRCERRVCDPNPCLYGGVCLPVGDNFQCQCPPQYTGRSCDLLLAVTAAPNPCNSQPCLNGGTCSSTSATTFACSCSSSYYGRCCEIRNFCQPSPCYNGGSCIATTNAYICQCTYPYTGSNCETAIATRAPQPMCPCILCPCPTPAPVETNPCLPNPCQNNGGCSAAQNIPQCHCQPAYSGYYCEYRRKRSLGISYCANVTCLNGGKCFDDERGPRCGCPQPYFGERCEFINRPRTCNPNPCNADGQCISTRDGYKCLCKNGRTGILCEQMVVAKNYRWCPLDCQSGTTCVYEGTSPKCLAL